MHASHSAPNTQPVSARDSPTVSVRYGHSTGAHAPHTANCRNIMMAKRAFMSVVVEVELGKLALEGGAADAEDLRGARAVIATALEDLEDVRALHVLEPVRSRRDLTPDLRRQ